MGGSSTAEGQPSRRTSPERMGGSGAVLSVQLDKARIAAQTARTVVLVEGVSDERAIGTLAERHGRDLEAEGVAVIAMAGATNARRFLGLFTSSARETRLAGICDLGETGLIRKALVDTGLGSPKSRSDLAQLGFFVCVIDLEDELIRSLGAGAVEQLIEAQGELRAFRSFQNQPAQRHKTVDSQLWRWLGNRKIRYADLLVEALDLARVPPPLQALLSYI